MSLQKTSKPNLKRRRCHLCGQFAGGNHVYANSIDIELHADEPLGVLYKIPKTSVAVSPVMVNDIQNCLTTLGLLQFLRPERRAIPNGTFLCSMRPSRVTPIVGDGNCLFTSLAVALGLKHYCGRLIRDIIVSNMNFINFPRNSLQTNFYSNDFPNQHHVVNCESVDEYLRISRMSENGVFGTCVEIFSFCQIFHLDVFLYHVPLKSWLMYECSANIERKGIFIQQKLNANHFEVVRELIYVTSENIIFPEVVSPDCQPCTSTDLHPLKNVFQRYEHNFIEPPSKKSKKRSDPFLCKPEPRLLEEAQLHNFVGVDFNKTLSSETCSQEATDQLMDRNLDKVNCFHLNDNSVAESESKTLDSNIGPFEFNFCGKCMRQPTLRHPFKMFKRDKKELKNRMFGNKLEALVVNLFELCLLYCTTEDFDWNNAWPSVFFSLLSNQNKRVTTQLNLLSLLPWELRQQWLGAINIFPSHVQQCLQRNRINGRCAVDGTLRLRYFQKLVQSLKQENIARALDIEPYPNVRCPFGCWCFIEESGMIQVKHFVNYFDKDFTSFQASSHLHLRGIRSDFLIPSLSLRQFLVAATVRVDKTEGLVVHTCLMHSKGSSVQYLQPPSHPVLTRTAVNFEERLSIIAPTLSFITNIRANFASHTYQLLKSVGSYSGMSTVRLKRKTRWDITSDILKHAEGFAYQFREDIRTLICQWVRQGKIIDDVALGMIEYETNDENVQLCLSQATTIDLETCIELTKDAEKNEKEYLNVAELLSCYTFAHGNDEYGCSPPPLCNGSNNVSWLLQAATSVSPLLCRTLVNSQKYNVNLRPFFFFLKNVLLGTSRLSKTNTTVLLEQSEKVVSSVLQENHNDNDIEDSEQCCCFVVGKFLSAIADSIHHFPLKKRTDINWVTNMSNAGNVTHVVVTTKSANNLRNKMEPPFNLTVFGTKCELIAVGTTDEKSNESLKILVRHAGSFVRFWLLYKKKKFAEKVEADPLEALQGALRGYWNIAFYQVCKTAELADLKWEFMSSLTGQGIFICKYHNVPLTRDFRKSGFRCKCGRASFLRCPHLQCQSNICRHHFAEGLKQPNNRVFVDSVPMTKTKKRKRRQSDNSELSSTIHCPSTSSLNTVRSELSEPDVGTKAFDATSINSSSVALGFCTGNEGDDENTNVMARLKTYPDTKLISVELERKEECYKLPLHILLNSQCNLLYRHNGNPISLSLKEKRFLENIAATATYALPLLQPEALLFPSIFWCQAANGSFLGAIPAALYNSSRYNKQLGFAGLEDMLRTRIKDGSLLTSCNATYLQYVFDSLLNMELHKTDIRVILNRGWQEVNSAPRNCSYLSTPTFKFDYAESRKNVCELAALIRDKNPTYFVTYTRASEISF